MVQGRLDRTKFLRVRGNTDLFGSFELFARNTIVPFQELFNRPAAIHMFEKRLRGNASAFEDQSAAHHLWILRKDVGQFWFGLHAHSMGLAKSNVKGTGSDSVQTSSSVSISRRQNAVEVTLL